MEEFYSMFPIFVFRKRKKELVGDRDHHTHSIDVAKDLVRLQPFIDQDEFAKLRERYLKLDECGTSKQMFDFKREIIAKHGDQISDVAFHYMNFADDMGEILIDRHN